MTSTLSHRNLGITPGRRTHPLTNMTANGMPHGKPNVASTGGYRVSHHDPFHRTNRDQSYACHCHHSRVTAHSVEGSASRPTTQRELTANGPIITSPSKP